MYINLKNKPEWLLTKSPLGKVPCLELQTGETLYESLVISDYLDEAYPVNRLHPTKPLAKAQDRLLIERFNEVITLMYRVWYIENYCITIISVEASEFRVAVVKIIFSRTEIQEVLLLSLLLLLLLFF